MNQGQINIREGNQMDIPAIMQLILELADYEKALHEVKNTASTLAEDFSNAWFQTLVAELPDGQIAGMALYHPAYSTWKGRMWYLDDLVVTASQRQKGIGKMLLQGLIDKAAGHDVDLIKWQVLDWNEPAIKFYESLNVEFDKGWWNCRIKTKKTAM